MGTDSTTQYDADTVEEKLKTLAEGALGDPILKYFAFSHLVNKPGHPLRSVSEQFARLALKLAEHVPRSPERTVAFRKLLEGKDAAVRATLG